MRTLTPSRRDRSPKTSADAGFTLIELLITLAILGVAIVPLMLSYTRTWQGTVESQRRTTASMLARQRLEVLRGTTDFSGLSDGSGTFNAPYTGYNFVVQAEDLSAPDPNFQAKLLRIKVEYPSMYGGRRTIACPRDPDCPEWDYAKIVTQDSP